MMNSTQRAMRPHGVPAWVTDGLCTICGVDLRPCVGVLLNGIHSACNFVCGCGVLQDKYVVRAYYIHEEFRVFDCTCMKEIPEVVMKKFFDLAFFTEIAGLFCRTHKHGNKRVMAMNIDEIDMILRLYGYLMDQEKMSCKLEDWAEIRRKKQTRSGETDKLSEGLIYQKVIEDWLNLTSLKPAKR